MEYNGKDVSLAMGAPGSRGSGTIRLLSLMHEEINRSDETEELKYDRYYTDEQGRERSIGWHRGAYWGPYHTHGKGFDNISEMTKEQAIAEFKAPYADWDSGIKIVKSHWFSYDIPQLQEWFPEATLLCFYMEDQECFDWWHEVGGWDIKYPHYQWYENDEGMMNGIIAENDQLREHFDLKHYYDYDLSRDLGLSENIRTVEEMNAIDDKIQTGFGRMFSEDEKMEMVNIITSRTKVGVIKQKAGVIKPQLQP